MDAAAHEAMTILGEGGCAVAAVNDTQDVFNDPHLKARGFFEQVEHPAEGTITLMNSPIRMSESKVPLKSAPTLGGDTDQVLGDELGLSGAEIDQLHEEQVIFSRARQAGAVAGD